MAAIEGVCSSCVRGPTSRPTGRSPPPSFREGRPGPAQASRSRSRARRSGAARPISRTSPAKIAASGDTAAGPGRTGASSVGAARGAWGLMRSQARIGHPGRASPNGADLLTRAVAHTRPCACFEPPPQPRPRPRAARTGGQPGAPRGGPRRRPGGGWISSRRGGARSRPIRNLAHDRALHRRPITTLDDHLARAGRSARRPVDGLRRVTPTTMLS
jgi:hypothetical protein